MNRINTKDGGVYPMVYTILYQFGDGLYHPILVICWMIHSWVYYTRHFSTVFFCANVHFPSAYAEFRLMLVEWSGALPFFFCVCVSGCLCLLIEPHFGYSNISNYQVRMFAAPNPNFSSYKTWLVVCLPLWKIYDFVSYCSILFPINMESHKIPWFQSPPSRNRHVWGQKRHV